LVVVHGEDVCVFDEQRSHAINVPVYPFGFRVF
jgi:hypothetical protein